MRQVTVSRREENQRFFRFLEQFLSLAPKSFLYKMLRKKNITLNGKKADGRERLHEGDVVTFFLSDETMEKFLAPKKAVLFSGREVFPAIIYEDEDILVVNKPRGMLSQKAKPTDVSLVEQMETMLLQRDDKMTPSDIRIGICNRLDRNTTGLVVAGKTTLGLQWFNRLFRERTIKKYYICLVEGRLEKSRMIDGFLTKDEKNNRVTISKKERDSAARIVTAYEPLASRSVDGYSFTLLRVQILTGKSHQIRAHLHSIGHSVLGDKKYRGSASYQKWEKEERISGQLLHAYRLCIPGEGDLSEAGNTTSVDTLPERYRGMVFTAPLPADFMTVLKKLGMDGSF